MDLYRRCGRHVPYNQSTRRFPKLDVAGSDPGLPLQLFNNGIHQQLPSSHFTQLSGENGIFELFCRFGAPGQGRRGVNVNRHADPVATLVSRDFGIDPGVMAETGMRSPRHHNFPSRAR